MLLNTIIKKSCKFCLRTYSKSASKPKVLVVPDETVLRDISNEVYKPRKHPGIMQNKTVTVPDTFVKAAVKVLEDYPVKELVAAGDVLARHLQGKVPPMEKLELKETVKKIKERVLRKFKNVVIKNEEDERRYNQMIKDRINKIISEKIYNWKAVKYDATNSLVYMIKRFAPEYAVLLKILGEIASRDPDFIPRSFFDFGSGVGSATWAVNNYWKQHIFEYFNVDVSPDMNDLAQILLQGGKTTGTPLIKGTFYRQFLPASNNEYDLVISAYSMLELPSLETRLETVLNLWNKTQHYLIIVEQGTNAGFKVVNELRDFILQIDNTANSGYVFSPCSHDLVCPRFMADDGTPCNFEVAYFNMPIGQKVELNKERYSYVVLKKGSRPESLPWPRIIRPTLVKSKHSICRVCTASGKLGEVIFTAKRHGKMTYHCARSSKWGDLLPVTLEENNIAELSNSSEDDSKTSN